jgi:hypothetical protein
MFVPGDFRNGKSFLLNLMIRYLEAGGDPDWMLRDEDFWIPKPKDESFLTKAKGFIFR